MKPKEDLFQLIKSLSKSEKRYFTLDAQKSSSKTNNYLEIFRAINAMKVYDETTLRKKYKHFSVDKSYLYEAILKSMRDYRSPKSKRAQLKQRIMDAKFLYERGLYEQCAGRLKSAKTIANELSDSLALLEINREERRLLKELGHTVFRENLECLKNEKTLALKSLDDEFKYLELYDYLSLEVSNHFRYSKKEDEVRLKTLMDPSEWEEPSGFQSKLWSYRANALFYHLVGEDEKSGLFFNKSAEIWEKHPIIRREEFFRYIIDLANVVSFSFIRGELKSVALLLEKLEAEKPGSFVEEELKFRRLIIYRLLFARETKDFKKAEALEQDVETGLGKFKLKDREKLVTWIQLALLFLEKGKNDRSRFWIRKIIEFKDLSIRPDVQKAARILELLISSLEDEYDIVELQIRSVSRFLKKSFSPEAIKFEIEFISFYKKILPFPFSRKEINQLNKFSSAVTLDKGNSTSIEVLQTWLATTELKR